MKPTKKAASSRSTTPRSQERQKGDVTDPIKTIQLIDAVGVSRASRSLGVSTTTLHKARKPGAKVSRVIEVAAAGALREIGGEPISAELATFVASVPRSATKAFLLEVDADKASTVEQFAKMVHGKLIAA
jgi:hypothetical protein